MWTNSHHTHLFVSILCERNWSHPHVVDYMLTAFMADTCLASFIRMYNIPCSSRDEERSISSIFEYNCKLYIRVLVVHVATEKALPSELLQVLMITVDLIVT